MPAQKVEAREGYPPIVDSRAEEAREECERRSLDPDDYAADGVLVWMVVDLESRAAAQAKKAST